jgi:hypothetical protein
MSEWWTYSLSDFLLFSPRTYYRLFELYNAEWWPAQIVAVAAGVAILALLFSGGAWRGRAVAVLLAAAWLWVAWAFQLERYATINWAATWFAAGFALEALLLVWTGLVLDRFRFTPSAGAANAAGLCIFLFVLAVLPLIGPLVGRSWTQLEIFAFAPDPTALGTLGLLLAAAGRVLWALMLIPLAWCAISAATLWTMDAADALALPSAALAAFTLASWRTLFRRRNA